MQNRPADIILAILRKSGYNNGMLCKLCPRNCNIDRGVQKGFCGESNKLRVAKIIENFMWEEPCVSGDKGALAIFFSGCNLRCDFCQNYELSHIGKGREYTVDEFCKLIEGYDLNRFSSIDLISPSQFSDLIAKALQKLAPPIPVVYNTNSYEKVEAIKQIAPYVDIFLPDLKFYDRQIAMHSGASDYFEVASKAIIAMAEEKPNRFKDNDLVQGVLIRHLILPGCVKDSLKLLEFIKTNIKDPVVSIMSQFTPTGRGFSRRITPLELKTVLAHAQKLGLDKGYFQDLDSANSQFIPKF